MIDRFVDNIDWILMSTTIMGTFLLGRKSNKGNMLLFLIQPLWAWFAVETNNKGLLPLAVALFFVYLRNWWKWRRDAQERLW